MIVEKVRSVSAKAGKKIRERIYREPVRKKEARDASSNIENKRGSDTYNYKLIDMLKEENRLILIQHRQILQYAEEEKFDFIPAMLKDFNLMLMDHLKKEDIELNYYLDYCYRRGILREDLHEALAGYDDFRSAMKEETIEIDHLMNRSAYIPVTKKTVSGFLSEFSKLGKILIIRIYNEETILYPVYLEMNPHKIPVR